MKKLHLVLIGDEDSQKMLDQLDVIEQELESLLYDNSVGDFNYPRTLEDIQAARARVFATCNPTGFELKGE